MGLNGIDFEKRSPMENADLLQSTDEIVKIALAAGIPFEQILHVGGIPVMLHSCASSGQDSFAINWRGTADIDMAITTAHGAQRLGKALEHSPFRVITQRPSRSIPNKHAIEVELGTAYGFFPQGRKLEIDVYGGDRYGEATINHRKISPYPQKIIQDQAIKLTLWRKEFMAPTVVDLLILKTDVLRQTVRGKDLIDISALIFSAEKNGLDADDLVAQIRRAHSTQAGLQPYWQKTLVPALKEISKARNELRSYPFVPVATGRYLNSFERALDKGR